MFRTVVIAFSLLILCGLPSYALLDAQIDTWYSDSEGSFTEESGAGADFHDELGLTGSSEAVSASLTVGTHHQVCANSLSFSLDGSSVNADSFSFDGRLLPRGSRLKSQLEISSVGAAYRFEVGSDILRIGFMAGLEQYEFDLMLKPDGGAKSSRGSEAIMPMLGLFASGHPLPFANFKASASAGKYDFGDESRSLKIELQLLMEIPPGFYLGFGYRHLELMHESGDFDIDTTLQGPMAFVGFRL